MTQGVLIKIRNQQDIEDHAEYLVKRVLSNNTVLLKEYTAKDQRTLEQNKMIYRLYREISKQKGDMDPVEMRNHCKLYIGVPLLRAYDDDFREQYEHIRPLPTESKLAIMGQPIDLPVTRLMSPDVCSMYIDKVIRYWAEKGVYISNEKYSESA